MSAGIALLLEEDEENPKGFIVFAEAVGGLDSSSNIQKGCSQQQRCGHSTLHWQILSAKTKMKFLENTTESEGLVHFMPVLCISMVGGLLPALFPQPCSHQVLLPLGQPSTGSSLWLCGLWGAVLDWAGVPRWGCCG